MKKLDVIYTSIERNTIAQDGDFEGVFDHLIDKKQSEVHSWILLITLIVQIIRVFNWAET